MPTRVASLRFEIDDQGALQASQRLRTEIKRVGDDSKVASQNAGQAAQQAGSQIVVAWSNVARATADNQSAQKNLQQALQATQKAGADDAKAILNLAAAQKAAADASARLVTANKEVADSTKKGEEGFNGIESAERRGHIAGQLIGRTLGIEMPKALETVMSRSQLLGPVFSAAFGAGVFLAASAAIFEIGKKIAEAAESAGGMTEKVKELVAELHKANQERFFNPDTLKEADAHLEELRKKKEKLTQIANTPVDNPNRLENGLPRNITRVIAQRQLKLIDGPEGQNNINTLLQDQTKLTSAEKQRLDELTAKEKEAGLKGFALLKQQHDDELKLLADTTAQKEKQSETYEAARRAADAKYAAGVRELSRQTAQEKMAADDKVAENALHDENRIRLAEADRIKELRAETAEKLGISQAEVDKRAEFQAKVAEVHQDAALKIKQQDIEVMKIQQQTNDQISQRAESYLVGTAKILAAQQRELAGIKSQRDELQAIDGNEQTDVRVAKERDIAAQEVSINEAAAQQIKQAHKQAAEEIIAAQEESSLAAVPLWQRATAQIEISLTKRFKSIDEESQKEIESLRKVANDNKISQQQADTEILAIEQETQTRRVALWDVANLKIREQHKQQVSQLGSELESVFSDIGSGNIGKRILANMKKLFAQIIAEWILSMGQMKSGAGSILGSLVFGPGTTGAGVFGGGGSGAGGGGGGLGGLLGGLFGGNTQAGAAGTQAGSVGTPPFIPPGTTSFSGASPSGSSAASTGQLFGSSLGNIFGSGNGTAGVSPAGTEGSTSSTVASSLGLGGFFGQQPASSTSLLLPGGALSTQSISDTIGAVTGNPSTGGSQPASGGLPGLANLLHGGIGNSALGLGSVLAPLLGGLAGGPIGQVGGAFAGLLLSAVLQPTGPIAGLLANLGFGIGGPLATLAGPIAGGLLGFGIGAAHGGLLGGLSGAGAGAGIGFLFGGPVGAAIGAIAGLLGGIFGGIFGGAKRKKQANSLADNTLLPDIKKIMDEYKSFQLTGAAANQQLDQLETQAKTELGKLKGEGRSVLDKKVEPTIADARKQIAGFETERNRRSGLVFGPPQFHEGGIVNATVQRWNARPNELLAVLKDQEFVVNPQATSKNLKTLQRINAGETITGDIGDVHMHFYERVDEVYMRNKGMQVIMDTLRRAQREGML